MTDFHDFGIKQKKRPYPILWYQTTELWAWQSPLRKTCYKTGSGRRGLSKFHSIYNNLFSFGYRAVTFNSIVSNYCWQCISADSIRSCQPSIADSIYIRPIMNSYILMPACFFFSYLLLIALGYFISQLRLTASFSLYISYQLLILEGKEKKSKTK